MTVQNGEECSEVEEFSDLSFLENVCESAVLLCLKKRFHRDAIYALGERGFHIFYELLDGLSENEKQRLFLQEPETYYYLNQSDTISTSAGFRITEIRIVASLLQISPEALQKSITQHVTNLGVNSLEQLCRNFANEQIRIHSIESLISQEQDFGQFFKKNAISDKQDKDKVFGALGRQSHCPPPPQDYSDEPSAPKQRNGSETKATDHTFLQKCHYHHGDSSCYSKPKLPLPVFTLQHYCGPVTYQVHNFLSKNRDRLSTVAREVLVQSRLKLLSDLIKRESNVPQSQVEKSQNKCLAPTLTGRCRLTLQEFTCRLKRSHTLFIRCISPNSKKLPGIFDVEFVSSQLRNSGILEAVQLMKDGYPIRIPLRQFVNRYGHLAGKGNILSEDREYCSAVLTKIFGDSSALYQIGISKIFLKERAREILQKRWGDIQSLAALTLQKNLRGFLNRKNFQVYRRKITVVQAHVRGRQARQVF
ncbi:unconventional myosin-XVB-like [Ranitomeya variabilis]|uniref:unconventional myosin-XVB-like n=1 Tax=Ranitomeya variabilis TaxID=490064 RepID=UPI004057A6C4